MTSPYRVRKGKENVGLGYFLQSRGFNIISNWRYSHLGNRPGSHQGRYLHSSEVKTKGAQEAVFRKTG